MREKDGRYGRFLGCSNWPRCNGSRDLSPNDKAQTNKPRRRAGLRMIHPEAMAGTMRRTETRPYPLTIYDPDDEEMVPDRPGEDRPDAEPTREP
jgi:ssDNA-binding Zn-finger/Zn-ribbon topoisomerase 1